MISNQVKMDDEFITTDTGDSGLFRREIVLSKAIQNHQTAVRNSSNAEGGDSISTMSTVQTTTQPVITQTPQANDSRLQQIIDMLRLDKLPADGGTIKSIINLIDINGDGNISSEEIAAAEQNEDVIDALRNIHPLVAKALNDPNFRIQQIKQSSIKPSRSSSVSNQVNEAQQANANFIDDVNKFNVEF